MYFDNATFEQIAASLAHEVKNPLSLVRANIELLELTDTGKQYEKNYKVMRREIDRIHNLLYDFIQIASPANIVDERLNINLLLDELCESLECAYKNTIDFDFEYEQDSYIKADEKKIRQVFYNIIKNSIESIAERDVHGIIGIRVTESDGSVTVTVTDNGKGITDGEAERMNEPFFTTKKGGSGLGVYFCRSVIARHNGVFEIRNRDDETGCVVTVKLPN